MLINLPRPVCLDLPYLRLGNSKYCGHSRTTHPKGYQFSYGKHLFVINHGATVSLVPQVSAMPDAISIVFFPRTPREVLKAIVRFNPVQVACLHAFGAWADKSEKDKVVFSDAFASLTKYVTRVALAGFLASKLFPVISFLATVRPATPNAAVVTNTVTVEAECAEVFVDDV